MACTKYQWRFSNVLSAPIFCNWIPQLGHLCALFVAVFLVAGCATSPHDYRLEAEIGDLLGPPETATATRGPVHWTIERRVYTRMRRVRLSREGSIALDAALSNPTLFARPEPLSGEECLDAAPIILDIIKDGQSRRLILNCETSPGLEAVLRILFS